MEILLALVLPSFWSTKYFHSEEAALVFSPSLTSLWGDGSCSCVVWTEFSVALEEWWCCGVIRDCCVQAADKSVFLMCATVETVLLTPGSCDLHILALFYSPQDTLYFWSIQHLKVSFPLLGRLSDVLTFCFPFHFLEESMTGVIPWLLEWENTTFTAELATFTVSCTISPWNRS